MFRLTLALLALLLFSPVSKAADTFLPNPGECVVASGSFLCDTTVGYAIDPGPNAVALYVSADGGPWAMLACVARHPTLVTNGYVFVNWIQRQHGYRFRGKGQANCDPAVVNSGVDKHSTGLDRALAFFGAPAVDAYQWAKVYRYTPNGAGGYFYHYLSFCQVWNGKSYSTSVCWSLDPNAGQVFTRRTGEVAAFLAGTANGQALSPDTYPTFSSPVANNGTGPLCMLKDTNSYGPAYWKTAFDVMLGRWDNAGAPAFTGWGGTPATAMQIDCDSASLAVVLANDAKINTQLGRGYATVEQ